MAISDYTRQLIGSLVKSGKWEKMSEADQRKFIDGCEAQYWANPQSSKVSSVTLTQSKDEANAVKALKHAQAVIQQKPEEKRVEQKPEAKAAKESEPQPEPKKEAQHVSIPEEKVDAPKPQVQEKKPEPKSEVKPKAKQPIVMGMGSVEPPYKPCQKPEPQAKKDLGISMTDSQRKFIDGMEKLSSEFMRGELEKHGITGEMATQLLNGFSEAFSQQLFSSLTEFVTPMDTPRKDPEIIPEVIQKPEPIAASTGFDISRFEKTTSTQPQQVSAEDANPITRKAKQAQTQQQVQNSGIAVSGPTVAIPYPANWGSFTPMEKCTWLVELIKVNNGLIAPIYDPMGQIPLKQKAVQLKNSISFLPNKGEMHELQIIGLCDLLTGPKLRARMSKNGAVDSPNAPRLTEVPIDTYAKNLSHKYDMCFTVPLKDPKSILVIFLSTVPEYNSQVKSWSYPSQFEVCQYKKPKAIKKLQTEKSVEGQGETLAQEVVTQAMIQTGEQLTEKQAASAAREIIIDDNTGEEMPNIGDILRAQQQR